MSLLLELKYDEKLTLGYLYSPQISEWIISTYLAFEHRRTVSRQVSFKPTPLIPSPVPKYLELQKEAHWERGKMLTIEDAVSKTMFAPPYPYTHLTNTNPSYLAAS